MEMVENASRAKPSLTHRFLAWFLPDHTKRLIFLSSLYGLMHPNEDRYMLLKGLANVNSRLDLTDNVKGMVFPACHCLGCWSHLRDADRILAFADDEFASRCILAATPAWLTYNSREEMKADIKKLLAKEEPVTIRNVVSITG